MLGAEAPRRPQQLLASVAATATAGLARPSPPIVAFANASPNVQPHCTRVAKLAPMPAASYSRSQPPSETRRPPANALYQRPQKLPSALASTSHDRLASTLSCRASSPSRIAVELTSEF